MSASIAFLSPSQAARRLGVSAKALRLYEARGLLFPGRNSKGWRAYGPVDMARAAQIAALRELGLGLAQVTQVLDGDPAQVLPALAAHQLDLQDRRRRLGEALDRLGGLRAGLAAAEEPARVAGVSFGLPWPWGGERYELPALSRLTYITGPLGSGKTRLARRLAQAVDGAVFSPMERGDDGGAAARAALAADPGLRSRVDHAVAAITAGYAAPAALVVLLAALLAEGPSVVVVDMVEHGLDRPVQAGLVAFLRRGGAGSRPLVLMTRSSAILDLAAVAPDETVLYCPPNHSPPVCVELWPGSPGYDVVASSLASPQVRARTEGVRAVWVGRDAR